MTAVEAQAHGVALLLHDGMLTITAETPIARGALGAPVKAVPLGSITALDIKPVRLLSNGLLTIQAGPDTTQVHFKRKHAEGVRRVAEVLLSTLPAVPGSHSAPSAVGYEAPAAPVPQAALRPRQSDAQWFGPGQAVSLGKQVLPGGMIYVGTSLTAANGSGQEPALINPTLKVDSRNPDWGARTTTYWPAYHSITPQARAAYLHWLAGGRQQPDAPISWPFLFFYGLERRVLVDSAEHPLSPVELDAIRTEVRRLLDLYGANNSFRQYASSFLEFITNPATDQLPGTPPDVSGVDRWRHVDEIARTVGYFSKHGMPIPPQWALTWARVHPEIPLRTPANRCAAEFDQLFLIRYQAAFGEGIVVKPGKRQLAAHGYRTASSGIGHVSMNLSLPDVFTQAAARRDLESIVEQCTADLDSYSRYLGRNSQARGTLPAIALLPGELAPQDVSGLTELDTFLKENVGDRPAVVQADDLISLWPTTTGSLAKAEAVSLAQLLGRRGVGMEPDVRFGGPVLAGGSSAVLFKVNADAPGSPSPEYAAATLVTQLAAQVSASDGQVSDSEVAHLQSHVEKTLGLSASETARLHAHFQWLALGKVKATGLTKRLSTLTDSQRRAIGALLVEIATADGVVDPGEIKALAGIYKQLGLDPADVYSHVHASTTATPASQPVTVRPNAPGPSGYTVPPPHPEPGTPLRLDDEAIAAKLVQTAEVSALLSSIFVEDSEPAPAAVALPENLTLIGPLDGPHSRLLELLCQKDEWTRAEFDELCDKLEVLPDGALDRLNEAAYEIVGDPVIEDHDVLTINSDVAEEMHR